MESAAREQIEMTKMDKISLSDEIEELLKKASETQKIRIIHFLKVYLN